MSENKQEDYSSLIVIILIFLGIHWVVAGWTSNLFFKECRNAEDSYRNQAICDCQKSAFRKSFMLEQFAYSALTEDREIARNLGYKSYNITKQCGGYED